jgi:hypothetical protein
MFGRHCKLAKIGCQPVIRTSFRRPDAPDLMETVALPHLKCSTTSEISSAFALPSTGGDFNFATHVPSAACVSDDSLARGVTLT